MNRSLNTPRTSSAFRFLTKYTLNSMSVGPSAALSSAGIVMQLG